MTAPLPQGYPDWGRTIAENQVLEINDNNVINTGTIAYPIRYVGNAKTLMVWAQPITFACRFQLLFWGDAAGSILMDTYSIDCSALSVARQPVPILGPYMSAGVYPSGGGNYQYTFQVWHNSAPGVFAGAPIEPSLFSKNNVAIGAGGIIGLTSLNVQEGPISWTGSVGGGNWAILLFVQDYTGGISVIDVMDQSVSPYDRRTLWVPPMTISAQVSNFSAGATTYRLFATRMFNK